VLDSRRRWRAARTPTRWSSCGGPVKLLDDLSRLLPARRHPEAREAKKIASLLRAVADDVEP
jgi:hypothetical protein